jgi:membrane protein
MPPIFIIIIHCIGFFVGYQTATNEVFDQVKLWTSAAQEQVLRDIVAHYFASEQNLFQRILRIGIFVFASTSFFVIIQHALNKIWGVKSVAQNNILKILENRAISFVIIILMGVILVFSLFAQTISLTLHNTLYKLSPALTIVILWGLGILLGLLLGTLGFGVVFKILPDVIIEWKVVWIGAATTSFLFVVGNYLIGLALRNSNIKSMYGTTGSMAIFLLWVFYSSVILFYGAELTRQYARNFAKSIQPKSHAVRIETRKVEPDEN